MGQISDTEEVGPKDLEEIVSRPKRNEEFSDHLARWIISGGSGNCIDVWDGTKGDFVDSKENVFDDYNYITNLHSLENTCDVPLICVSAGRNRLESDGAGSNANKGGWTSYHGEEWSKHEMKIYEIIQKGKTSFEFRVLRRFEQDFPSTALTSNSHSNHLISGTSEGVIDLWEISAAKPIQKFDANKKTVTAVKYLDSNQRNSHFLSSSMDGSIRLFDVERGKCIQSVTHARPIFQMDYDSISDCIFCTSATGNQLSEKHTAFAYDKKSMKMVKKLNPSETSSLSRNNGSCYALKIVPKHKELVLGENALVHTCCLFIYDLRTFRMKKDLVAHKGRIEQIIEMDENEHRICTCARDHRIKVWEVGPFSRSYVLDVSMVVKSANVFGVQYYSALQMYKRRTIEQWREDVRERSQFVGSLLLERKMEEEEERMEIFFVVKFVNNNILYLFKSMLIGE